MIRVTLTFNTGPQAGKALAVAAVKPEGEALLQLAINKLRLKRRDAERARLFVWGRGAELPRVGDVRSHVANGEMIAISLGEGYAGGRSKVTTIMPRELEPGCAVESRWSKPRPGLAVVEWMEVARMNSALGRMSTLLEHPLYCALESPGLVDARTQRGLPSNKYEGHNLYANTLEEFERRAGQQRQLDAEAGVAAGEGDARTLADDASGLTAHEALFLEEWRAHGSAEVVISFAAGATGTLAHELCHARFALEPAFRREAELLWAEYAESMRGWMRDLGYHQSRHADEFAAYVLTEPIAFWRGRLDATDVRRARARFPEEPGGCELPPADAASDAEVASAKTQGDGPDLASLRIGLADQ